MEMLTAENLNQIAEDLKHNLIDYLVIDVDAWLEGYPTKEERIQAMDTLAMACQDNHSLAKLKFTDFDFRQIEKLDIVDPRTMANLIVAMTNGCVNLETLDLHHCNLKGCETFLQKDILDKLTLTRDNLHILCHDIPSRIAELMTTANGVKVIFEAVPTAGFFKSASTKGFFTQQKPGGPEEPTPSEKSPTPGSKSGG